MTKEFLLFVRLFSFAARGVSVDAQTQQALIADNEGNQGINADLIAKIISIASHQKASQMTDVALQDVFAQVDPDMAELCLKRVKMQIFSSLSVTDGLSELVYKLEENGIDACILKGMSLACLYSIPECRVSSDIDLLIDEKDEQKAYSVMRSMGYSVSPRTEYSHHASCTHPDVGLVELHTNLFFDMINDVIFDENDVSEDISKSRREFTVSGYTFKTLDVTENLIYVTMHMIQHFVRGGTSIRQICDILMYCRAFRDEIDFTRYFSLLDKLSYKGIYNVIMSVGVRYMGFSMEELPAFDLLEENVCDGFLSDLEHGGWIGTNREGKFETFRMYGKIRAQNTGKNEREYKKYWRKYQLGRMVKSIFPSRERLCAKFPFAKNPLLLIPAWLRWLWYGVGLVRSGELGTKTSADASHESDANRRIKLFSELGIIKTEE